ncbi:MAG: isochorismate synthase MenF, partial [Acidimicrobiales bacterium]
MKSTTERLDADLDMVGIGAASGMLWRRDELVMAGIGEACRIPVDRRSRSVGAAQAQEQLAALAGPDQIGLPGSGPVAFAAMPFDPDQPGELVIPRVLLVRGSEGRCWITVVSDGSVSPADGIGLASAVLADSRPGPAGTSLELSSPISPEDWRDKVAAARDRIRTGALTKAVLARELVLRSDAPLDQPAILVRLVAQHPSATVFALDGFVGASPELLVSRSDDVVRAHPLAGTAPRASAGAADQQMAAGLLASEKDRWEHRITIDWLLDELLRFCSYVDAEPEPSIVSLPNVHHLGTRVEGRLSSPAASVLELVAALHPTPAVGGDPQPEALRLIAELEGAERGRYAGPTGWVDGQGNGAFCVAIRSAQ